MTKLFTLEVGWVYAKDGTRWRVTKVLMDNGSPRVILNSTDMTNSATLKVKLTTLNKKFTRLG